MILYIDCKEGKTFVRELKYYSKFTGEQTKELKQEVNIDTIEDEFDKMMVKHELCKDDSVINGIKV